MRDPKTKDWAEDPRSAGRRGADRGVCIWHDTCHEAMADMKQSFLDNDKKVEITMKSKLDWKVFALFAGGIVTLGVAFVIFFGPLFLDISAAVTRNDTNLVHLMQESGIKPVAE